MPLALTRRMALLGAAAGLLPLRLRAEEVVELAWEDLVPESGRGSGYEILRSLGVVQHGELDPLYDQETAAEVTRAYDGQRIRLPGFAIPIEYDGLGATTMILAPYVGACIHVPPPPPNQLVLVTNPVPYEIEALFDPVVVTGRFGTAAVDAGLAQVGYTLEAETIEPYEG